MINFKKNFHFLFFAFLMTGCQTSQKDLHAASRAREDQEAEEKSHDLNTVWEALKNKDDALARQEALKALQRSQNPELQSQLNLVLGQIEARASQWSLADGYYEQALTQTKNPGQLLEIFFHKAKLKTQSEKWDDAEKAWDKVLEFDLSPRDRLQSQIQSLFVVDQQQKNMKSRYSLREIYFYAKQEKLVREFRLGVLQYQNKWSQRALDEFWNESQDQEYADLIVYLNFLNSKNLQKDSDAKSWALILQARYTKSEYQEKIRAYLGIRAIPIKNDLKNDTSEQIAVLLPLTGRLSSLGQKIKWALEEGFGGTPEQKAVLRFFDIQDRPDLAEKAIVDIASDASIKLVLGPIQGRGMEQVYSKAKAYQIPLLSLAPGEIAPADSVFSFSSGLQAQCDALAMHLMNRGIKNLAILTGHSAYSKQASMNFWSSLENYGGRVVAYEEIEDQETDYRNLIEKILGLSLLELREDEINSLRRARIQAKVNKRTPKTAHLFDLPPLYDFDAVFIPEDPKKLSNLIPTFDYFGAKNLYFVGPAVWNSSDLKTRGQGWLDRGIFVDSFHPEIQGEKNQKFRENFKSQWKSEPEAIHALGFDAGSLIARIQAENSSGLDRSDWIKKIEKIKTQDGLTGELFFELNKANRKLKIFQFQGEELKVF